MRVSRRLVPTLEGLERLILLDGAVLAHFGDSTEIVRAGNDHTAYAFPGMAYRLYTSIPNPSPLGFASVTYTFLPAAFDGYYTTTLGVPKSVSGATVTPSDPNDYMLQTTAPVFNAPKVDTNGGVLNVTIKVDMDVYVYNASGPNPPATTHKTDTLTLIVESPKVTNFTVAPRQPLPVSIWGTPTMKFVRKTGDQPNDQGQDLGFSLVTTQSNSVNPVSFSAEVANTTHYNLAMGFIQIVKKVSATATYTGGSYLKQAGSNFLDVSPYQDASNLWYNGYFADYEKGASATMPSAAFASKASDSPEFHSAATGLDFRDNKTQVWLKAMDYTAEFETSVAVEGGWLPSAQQGSPYVAGFPIGLSTARWHLRGNATIKADANNSPNPSSNTNATLDLTNWTIKVDAGAGAAPAQLPADAPSAWPAKGDDTPSYLSWTGNNGSVTQTQGTVVQGQRFAERPNHPRRGHPAFSHHHKPKRHHPLRFGVTPN